MHNKSWIDLIFSVVIKYVSWIERYNECDRLKPLKDNVENVNHMSERVKSQ